MSINWNSRHPRLTIPSAYQMISHRSLWRRSLRCIVSQRSTKVYYVPILHIVASIWYHWQQFSCTEPILTGTVSRHGPLPWMSSNNLSPHICYWHSYDLAARSCTLRARTRSQKPVLDRTSASIVLCTTLPLSRTALNTLAFINASGLVFTIFPSIIYR